MKFPDKHHLNSALGWLELGNTTEAWNELEKLSDAGREDVEALDASWKIFAAQKRWKEALAIGCQMVRMAPDDAAGWIHRSFALHELKRTAEAWTELLPAIEHFPEESNIPYNLACYACQLGELDTARRWLSEAMKCGGAEKMKAMALDDPDLSPLKEEIRKL